MIIKGKTKRLKEINDELKFLSNLIPKYGNNLTFEKSNQIKKEYDNLIKYKQFIQRLGKWNDNI